MSRSPAVLMYHDVGPGGGLYSLAPVRFREQVRMIGRLGLPVVRAGDLPSAGPRAVAITFDDGAKGVIEHALPVLAGAGLTATLFMTVSAVGALNWCSKADLRSWCEAGNELGTHGWDHTSLTAMPLEQALDDIARSKAALEDIVGQRVRTVSFPNGRLTRALVRAAQGIGLAPAFGSWPGYGVGRSGAYGRFAILDHTSDRTIAHVLHGRGGLAYAPQRVLFVLGRLVGEGAYVRLHRLLGGTGRAA